MNNRQTAWLVLAIFVLIFVLILFILGVSWSSISIATGIILIAAIILDFIEKSKQLVEADDQAEQIRDVAKRQW